MSHFGRQFLHLLSQHSIACHFWTAEHGATPPNSTGSTPRNHQKSVANRKDELHLVRKVPALRHIEADLRPLTNQHVWVTGSWPLVPKYPTGISWIWTNMIMMIIMIYIILLYYIYNMLYIYMIIYDKLLLSGPSRRDPDPLIKPCLWGDQDHITLRPQQQLQPLTFEQSRDPMGSFWDHSYH